ncbi:MAG: PilW family protein [Gammaproteobacteria bacterium]
MRTARNQSGITLVELIISLAIASMLLVGLHQLIGSSFATQELIDEQTELSRSARFAMVRMTRAVTGSQRLLVPMGDNPSTTNVESIRDEIVGTDSSRSAVLAVTLDSSSDLDANGIPDADNDGDGLIDEDLPADTTNDGEPGLRGFDDDDNGSTDFRFSPAGDDDESNDRSQSEDPINGVDDDGDGTIDEDPGADNNDDGEPGVAGIDDDGDGQIDEGSEDDDDEDGVSDEDWYDPVVFYLDGSTLVERRAVPWDQNGDSRISGRDYIESNIVEGVTYLSFERSEKEPLQRQLVKITLAIANANGTEFSLTTQVRLGGFE